MCDYGELDSQGCKVEPVCIERGTDQGQLNDSSSLSKILENQLVALLATSTVIFVWAAALAATLPASIAIPLMLADLGSTAFLLVFICKISLYVVSNAWFVLRGDTSLALGPF